LMRRRNNTTHNYNIDKIKKMPQHCQKSTTTACWYKYHQKQGNKVDQGVGLQDCDDGNDGVLSASLLVCSSDSNS